MQRHLFFAAALAAGLGAGGAWAQSTEYPVKLDNCGRTVSVEAAPERVVTIGQSATELLYALDLGDRVVGTSVWFNDVLPEYEEVDAEVERLADNDPSFESVVAKRPDLVMAQFEWHVGPTGSVGTPAQFADLGVPAYVMPTDCVGKDNTTGGDGTRTEQWEVDSIFRSIREVGTMFDVPARADALIADMKARQQAAVEAAESVTAGQDRSAVVWFSSPDIQLDAYVAGRKGVPAYMLETLGLENVIESDEEWPLVGWETIARANPDVIIIAKMDRRRYEGDDYRAKLEYLRSDPVTREMDAVKNDRIIIVEAHALHPATRLASGLETIASGLERMDLTQ